MIYRIVQGNSFQLHIIVNKIDISQSSKTIQACDINTARGVKVMLVSEHCEEVQLRYSVSGDASNEIVCIVPGDIDVGLYSLKVEWIIGGAQLTSTENWMLAIVPFNRLAKVPFGIIEGEPCCGMYQLKYYITTGAATGTNRQLWYGASASADVDSLDIGELTLATDNASGATYTIATTETKCIVWFVSTCPLTIMQAGLPASLNSEQKDGKYYYWSDELVAGDDNVYTIS